MNSTERKIRAERLRKQIEQTLEEKYKFFPFDNRQFFQREDGLTFSLFYMGGEKWDAFGVEYANTRQEAESFLLEDGDLFYIEDMTEQELIGAICKEIEDSEVE